MSDGRLSGGASVWFCWVPKLDGDPATGQGGLYRAMTRARAKYLCFLAVRDAGFGTIGFPDIRVRRERAFDGAEFTSGSMPRYARKPAAPPEPASVQPLPIEGA